MWVERKPQEIAKWHAQTAREARIQSLVIAGGLWLLASSILAGGWLIAGRAGVIAQASVAPGSFWARFPTFALGSLPFAFWFFRHLLRKELERSESMTICPKCDTAGESNSGTRCECGGNFVPQSSVRWVEESEPEARNSARP